MSSPIFVDSVAWIALLHRVMQERQIGEALTADHHFVQAGYNKLI